MSDKKWLYLKILSLIGIGLALYLLYQYYKPVYGGICNINDKFNCEPTTKGDLRDFLGLPVPVIGLAGYVIILVSSFLKKAKLAFAMATFGMLFCLRITILELFVVKVICPVCLLCQVVMLLAFIFSTQLAFQKSNDVGKENVDN